MLDRCEAVMRPQAIFSRSVILNIFRGSFSKLLSIAGTPTSFDFA